MGMSNDETVFLMDEDTGLISCAHGILPYLTVHDLQRYANLCRFQYQPGIA